MGIADGIMLAHHGPEQLAWMSLGDGTLGRVLDVCVAFLIGGLSLVPRAYAAGDTGGARALWVRTLPVAVGLGLAGVIAGLFGRHALLAMGQEPALAANAGGVMVILGLGYPAALVAIAAAVYLEGVRRAPMVAACVVAANLLNIALNWILIGGHLGAPALGARGSAMSTTLVRVLLGVALGLYAWRLKAAAPMGSEAASPAAQWRLGFGAAGTVAAMGALTASLTVYAGWLGVLPLATFSAAWNLAAPAGLLALGMADSAGLLVSAESGMVDERAAARVAWSGLGLTVAALGVLAVFLTVFAGQLSDGYSDDGRLAVAMAAAIPVVACVVLCDAAGFVMAASLRALREVAWPATIEIGSMLVLAPLAAWLAFGRGAGVIGLFQAMLTAAALRAALLSVRFWWRTRAVPVMQPVKSIETPC